MADFSGTLIPAYEDPINGVFNGDYYGQIINFQQSAIYRGRVGGEYVYAVGSAPVGATDVVIVGYT